MEIYDTAVLSRVVESLDRPQSFLLDRFFGFESVSPEETILFDVMNGQRRISPFVAPIISGKVVANDGFTTNSFKPAYVKDKRVFKPNAALRRIPGERIGGQLTGAERVRANLGFAMQDQINMLTGRLEWMAAKALYDSKYTVSGEGFADTEINFQRDVLLGTALTSTARWGETGVSPCDNLESWIELVLEKSGAVVTDIVFTPEAWKLFKADPQTKDAIDTTQRGSSSSIDKGPAVRRGAVNKGVWGTYNLWVYNDWYVDDSGTNQRMLPAYTVILSGPELEGVKHFGAIQDEEANVAAMPWFPKSWVDKDPPVRWLMMQSAPLVVPYRPNASCRVVVR